MSNDPIFCRQQALRERTDARDAILDNVRERCERSASTWEAMASRAERSAKLRTDRQAATPPEAALHDQ